MTEMTKNMKTHCVGRYLIDMPDDVLMVGGATVKGVMIKPTAMSHEAYLQEIADRKAELRVTKSRDQHPFLYADDEIDGQDTHYFIHRENPGYGPAYRAFESYKWDHGYRFKLEIDGYDYLHPDQTDKPSTQALDVKNEVPEKTALVFDLVKRLRWRADDDIPAEPGLCFLGAFLSGKAGDDEYAWAQFVPTQNRDVSIGIGSNSGIQESNTLLQRAGEINLGLIAVGGWTLRKGVVKLPGIDAEEWLFTGKTSSDVRGTKCLLEANSRTSNAQAPLLTLHLDSGSSNAFMQDEIEAASMSEAEAVALWDSVSRTLRPRPNAF